MSQRIYLDENEEFYTDKLSPKEYAARSAQSGIEYEKLDFLDAMGLDTLAEIAAGKKTDPMLEVIETLFMAAPTINTENDRTKTALGYVLKSALVPSYDETKHAAVTGVAVNSGESGE